MTLCQQQGQLCQDPHQGWTGACLLSPGTQNLVCTWVWATCTDSNAAAAAGLGLGPTNAGQPGDPCWASTMPPQVGACQQGAGICFDPTQGQEPDHF